MAVVGVVIRTKNEGRWIRYCLEALNQQEGIDRLEVALVDCNSKDLTVDRALSVFPDLRLVRYEGEYFPGKSINMGVDALPDVDYVVVLSAHCVPIGQDWLARLITPMESDNLFAASYCRQIPTNASTPENKRDLLNTFFTESREQKKDSFFHNAASIIRRSFLRELAFDDTLKHIEDRHWAEGVIDRGLKIYYNAECAVVHEHGLNQHDRKYRSFRGQGVSDLLRGDEALISDWESFAQNKSKVLVLSLSSAVQSKRMDEISEVCDERYDCHVLPKRDSLIKPKAGVISREDEWAELSLFQLLNEIVVRFAASGKHYEYVYFFDADKAHYRGRMPEEYLAESIDTGADLCVAVESYKEDFFVLNSDEASWVPVSDKIMDVYDNKPHFKKALYGEGMLIRCSVLITGSMPEAVFLDG